MANAKKTASRTTAKKAPSKPKGRVERRVPQFVAVHTLSDLVRFAQTTKKTVAGDCLRGCLPPTVFTLLSQLGEYLSTSGVNGERVVDTAHANAFAQLYVDAFHYDRDAVVAQITQAVADWNAANTDEDGHTVPFL